MSFKVRNSDILTQNIRNFVNNCLELLTLTLARCVLTINNKINLNNSHVSK